MSANLQNQILGMTGSEFSLRYTHLNDRYNDYSKRLRYLSDLCGASKGKMPQKELNEYKALLVLFEDVKERWEVYLEVGLANDYINENTYKMKHLQRSCPQCKVPFNSESNGNTDFDLNTVTYPNNRHPLGYTSPYWTCCETHYYTHSNTLLKVIDENEILREHLIARFTPHVIENALTQLITILKSQGADYTKDLSAYEAEYCFREILSKFKKKDLMKAAKELLHCHPKSTVIKDSLVKGIAEILVEQYCKKK